jgi:hypothetical protein
MGEKGISVSEFFLPYLQKTNVGVTGSIETTQLPMVIVSLQVEHAQDLRTLIVRR